MVPKSVNNVIIQIKQNEKSKRVLIQITDEFIYTSHCVI